MSVDPQQAHPTRTTQFCRQVFLALTLMLVLYALCMTWVHPFSKGAHAKDHDSKTQDAHSEVSEHHAH